MPKAKPKQIGVIYAGLRINKDSTLQCFMKGKEEMFFSKIKWVIIGHQYAATQEGDNLLMSRRPEHLGPVDINPETLDQWELQNKIAEQFLRNKRAANRAKGFDKNMWPQLKPLNEIYKKLKSYEERKAFIEYMTKLVVIGNK